MYNTYAQFAYKEKCKVLHCLIFLTQCTQTECSELCHILLTVQTNSKSIIFCITCTHAQYSLHNSVTNSAHCVIFWTQCHILHTVHRKGWAHKLSTLCHILDTVSYFAEGCAVHTNSAEPSMSEAGSAFDCKTMQKEQCCKEDALCQVFYRSMKLFQSPHS